MSNFMKDDVNVNVELFEELAKKLKQIEPDKKLEFKITVFKRDAHQGLDSSYYNIIRVTYPNVGRKKGEPRELTVYHRVWCSRGYLISKTGREFINVPDAKVIDELAKKYSRFGTVTIVRNDVTIPKSDDNLVIVDGLGNHLDCQYNLIESFENYEEALQEAKKKYLTDNA